ncbi:MAG: hypothetical protein RIC19_18635 [Phaeodactylibacter sp.]|uniref:hypothetical protein n=1 Tax=Phaeodactylibacter sp. TaxID=1940289 RepID=UPI0032EBCC9E
MKELILFILVILFVLGIVFGSMQYLEDSIPNYIIFILLCSIIGYFGGIGIDWFFEKISHLIDDKPIKINLSHLLSIVSLVIAVFFSYHSWKLTYENQLDEQALRIKKWEEKNNLMKEQNLDFKKLQIKNNCDGKVLLVFRFKDLENKWITRGWFHIKGGENANFDKFTFFNEMYIYGKIADQEKWGFNFKRFCIGNGIENDRKDFTVVNERFLHIDSFKLYGSGRRLKTFNLVKSLNEEYRVEVNCNC